MAGHDDDLSIKQLFRVIFMQGGQVAVGTAIGMGVVLLVGIVGMILAPIWLPIFAIWYWRKEKRGGRAGGDAAPTAADGVTEASPGDVDVSALPEAVVIESSRLEHPSESR